MTKSDSATVVHKAARECPIIEPHPRSICGLVKAREERQRVVPPPPTEPPTA